jgi:hypothetical protein
MADMRFAKVWRDVGVGAEVSYVVKPFWSRAFSGMATVWLPMAAVERNDDIGKRREEQLSRDVFIGDDEDMFAVEFACFSS